MNHTLETAPAGHPVRTVPASGLIQRCGGVDCPPGTCDHTDDPADAVQRSVAGPAAATGGSGVVPVSVLRVLNTPGSPLDASTRSTMETRLGHDFGAVRVHTEAEAARSAQSIRAQAYTFGPHVVMGPGRFRPGTANGSRLLAHELTHVVQQSHGPAAATPTSISSPQDTAEREAEAVATDAVSG
jgi:D-serine deaminase-like pyridoxal phosphate-dependent protein